MKQRFLAIFLTLVMCLSLVPISVFAAEPTSGTCGDNVTWTLENGMLTISGNGAMEDFTSESIPWRSSKGKITTVVINDGITSVGGMAFSECASLISVTIPNSVTSIGYHAFIDCTGLTSVIIPNSVTSIGSSAFSGCTSLTSVTIPNRVVEIASNSFVDCTSLMTIEIDERNPSYISVDGVLFTKDMKTLVVYPGGKAGAYIIPDGVNEIGCTAFYHCPNLTSVTIPDSVRKIGQEAFPYYMYESLKDVYYTGTEEQWRKIYFQNFNEALFHQVTRHFNSTGPEGPDTPDVDPSITVTGGDREIEVGERGTIYANASNPSGREGRTWTWTSSDANIVSFSENSPVDHMEGVDPILNEGKKETVYCNINFYGRSPGTATLTCTLDDGTVSGPVQIVVVGKDPSISGPTLADLTYSFGNNDKAYGYSEGYRIPLERYRYIFGDTPLAHSLHEKSRTWGGNCGGMSSTSCLFFETGNGISTSAFKNGAALPSELSVRDRNNAWNLTLTEFIEAMQIGQNTEVVLNDYINNKDQLNRLCQAVTSFHQTGQEPVIIVVYGLSPDKDGNFIQTGHAIVGYDIVNVSSTKSNLMVYDCNYPNTERYITLTKNPSGQYTGWYYHLNDLYDWGSNYDDSFITYATYSHFLEVWDNREGVGNAMNLLNVNTPNATIKDGDGNAIAVIRDGKVVTDRKDIYPLINVGITTDGKSTETVGTSVWLPSDSPYTVENTDRSVSSFEATMVNVEQSATVNTTASEVIFAVNDEQKMTYAKLGETSGDSYTITLSSTLDNSYGDVELKGTATEDSAPVLAQISGKLYADGVDMSSASLRVDGAAKTESILSGTLPQNSLLGTTGVSLPTVEKIPAAGTAYARTQTMKLDGRDVEFQCYAVKDANGNETNYVKLRDLAQALNNTNAQFNVGWDGKVSITSNTAYQVVGGEGTTPYSGNQPYKDVSNTPVNFNGSDVNLTSFSITYQGGGYTYYKLRDLGQLLNFNVKWDGGVVIETDNPYTGE